MPVSTFDPKRVIVIIGGVPMSGFADGTFVSVERDEDSFSKVTGADGFTSRAKSNNKSGTMSLTLAQTSPSNDVLSGFLIKDELSGLGVVPVSVTDFSGRTALISAFAWIKKPPTVEFGKEITDREWSFDLTDLFMTVGGNAPTI